ncbi:RING/U-box [Glarea lozoyensis ATCC 20868]|uniref:RING/U-box n=1 Tax=Glarea lozoyensis (strain ATCC 20868 / MF5171) TaxID=1116229 RepID=S3D835_GLAL2|nr:RING/U-box [Glarea lozoyensis ATCC 20868]EPE34662.1 RING/U-box [Glarea lozoyensis ATCC 20868]
MSSIDPSVSGIHPEWLKLQDFQDDKRPVSALVKFANNQHVDGHNSKLTTLIIALCNVTGWSADSISLKLRLQFDVHLTAQDIWDFNKQFMAARDNRDFDEAEMRLMVIMGRTARAYSVTVFRDRPGKRIQHTPRPVVNPFPRHWNPNPRDLAPSTQLLPGYSAVERQAHVKEMEALGLDKFHTKLFPLEEKALEQIGQQPAFIITGLLRRWFTEVLDAVRLLPPEHPLDIAFHDQRSAQYTQTMLNNLQKVFGSHEFTGIPYADGLIKISSFADGCRILMDTFFEDRLRVIAYLRDLQIRQQLASKPNPFFSRLDIKDIADDDKECPICREEFGDNDTVAIRLDVCCKKIIGANCLMDWMRIGDTCPCCRHELGVEFYHRLCLEVE